ncbi:MAG: HAD hydrolase-like protein [Chloroflexi bacterium]|nr:HAD hydrolase-like protein [Chloroflexota bacterium]MBT5627077.1 HAD hydrolase-like protein [Chloroflexota bacterium]
MFQHALSALQVAPEEALHVGDDTVDVEGARGIGTQVVHIDHTGVSGSSGGNECHARDWIARRAGQHLTFVILVHLPRYKKSPRRNAEGFFY